MTLRDDQSQHFISLRARRLSRPTFVQLPPLSAEPLTDNYAGVWAKSHLANCRGLLSHQTESQSVFGGPCDLLALAQNFGTFFLGETFYCHITLHNDSQVECRNVVLKVAAKGSAEYTPLAIRGVAAGQLPSVAEGGGAGGWPVGGYRLRPHENFNAVVQHDLKELGENILMCSVSYVARVPLSSLAPPTSAVQPPPAVGAQQPLTASLASSKGEGETEEEVTKDFIKNFKITVEKPFNFRQTQIAISGSDMYVEAEIENLTQQPLMVQRIAWEPGPLLKVTDLNSLVDWTKSRQKGKLTSAYMAPHEVWRLLYRIQPLNPQTTSHEEEMKLGHLDIAWRAAMGETGHLRTFPFTSTPPKYSDVSVKILEVPSQVVVEEPFQMVCEVTNRSSRTLNLLLSRPEGTTAPASEATVSATDAASAATTVAAFPAFIWTGVTQQRLESLASGASNRLDLEFVPVMTGLQEVPPLELREISTENCFVFTDLGRIFVISATAAA